MDNIETRSNYSISSASASTLSGFSNYKDEFLELRHNINPTKYPEVDDQRCKTPTAETHNENSQYEERIQNLTHQLQNSLKQNEKYKNDLYHLEKKVEISYNDKIEKLIKNNNLLQTQLNAANSQIDRLIKNCSHNNSKTTLYSQEISNLETKNHNLNLENSILKSANLQYKSQINENEVFIKKLKIDINDNKLNIEAKNSCITQLKNKISEQQVEIHNLVQSNLELSNANKLVTNELEHLRKTENWYKEQLHMCQHDKQILMEDILKYKSEISQHDELSNSLKIEVVKLKNKLQETELKALRDKEVYIKQFKIVEPNNIEILDNNVPENNDYILTQSSCYESTIQDLTDEVIKIRESYIDYKTKFENMSKENSDLLSECLKLQKIIQQNEILIEQLENCKKDVNMQLKSALESDKEKLDELLILRNNNSTLTIELSAMKKEKDEVESSISLIREQFTKFKQNYESLKHELHNSNKHVLQMQQEKQELFMNNNWTLCELEKTKEKDIVITNLKEKIKHLELQLNDSLEKIKSINTKHSDEMKLLEDKVESLNKHKVDLERDKNEEIKNYEQVLSQYKCLVTNYESDKSNLHKQLHDSKDEVIQFKDNIKILEKEINERDLKLNHLQKDICETNGQLQLAINEKNSLITENKKLVNNFRTFVTNNYSNDMESNFMAVIKYINEISKVPGTDNFEKYEDIDTNLSNLDCMKIIYDKINSYMQNIPDHKILHNESNEMQKSKVQKLGVVNIHEKDYKNNLFSKISHLEERVKSLQDKYDELYQMIGDIKKPQSVNENLNKYCEEIEHLRAALKVKELDGKQKQKKYESNYRILLRKVKEHMKGRNSAEKQNNYLQELYNALSDENNTLKLTISSKGYEIENLNKLLESHASANKKLKQTLNDVEKELMKSRICENCIEFQSLSNNFEELQKYTQLMEEKYNKIQQELILTQNLKNTITKELQDLSLKNTTLIKREEELASKLNDLEKENKATVLKNGELEVFVGNQNKIVSEINEKLARENEKYLGVVSEKHHFEKELKEEFEKTQFLVNEIELLKAEIKSKNDDIIRMQDIENEMKINWTKKELNTENTITTLRNYLKMSQNENNSIKSEKYFLQRLCNDLKIALRTHVSLNQVLKEQINNLTHERPDFNSLPNLLPDLPSTQKYDDKYVNQLLQQNRAPIQDKPLVEIQDCLDTLKKEVMNLQQEIADKNNNQ